MSGPDDGPSPEDIADDARAAAAAALDDWDGLAEPHPAVAFDLLVARARLERLRPELRGADGEVLLTQLAAVVAREGEALVRLALDDVDARDWCAEARATLARDAAGELGEEEEADAARELLMTLDDLELLAAATADAALAAAVATCRAVVDVRDLLWVSAAPWLRALAGAVDADVPAGRVVLERLWPRVQDYYWELDRVRLPALTTGRPPRTR